MLEIAMDRLDRHACEAKALAERELLDGVQLQELDFVDLGELISPPGVVPVVIKSLLFS